VDLQRLILNKIRIWWRPIICLAMAGIAVVHGIFVPLYLLLCKSQYFSDLMGLSALLTTIVAAFAVREWGKHKGND
jgi:hypothetical protein